MTSLFDNDDEEFDFSPSTSSNLSSLFGTFTSPRSEDSSDSLKYRAPKQPSVKTSTKNGVDTVDSNSKKKMAEKSEKSSVVLAKVVTLWKIDTNKQNTNAGKHIIAIIGSPAQNLFELIAYKDKNFILIRKTLNDQAVVYKYENNFVSFYDNQNQFWSVSFENDKDLESLLVEIRKNKAVIVDKTKTNQNTSENKAEVTENKTDYAEGTENQDNNPDFDKGNPDSSLTKTKADILSRITKMGQQILPENPKLQANTSTELSDSDLEEARNKKPLTIPRKQLKKLPQKIVQNEFAYQNLANQNVQNNNNQIVANTQHLANYPQNVLYSQPFPEYAHTNFLLTQNLELKASLNEINAKLNNVLNGNTNSPQSSDETRAMKSKIKILNLKIDNLNSDLQKSERKYEKLKEEYDEKCKELRLQEDKFVTAQQNVLKIDEFAMKISDLESKIESLNIVANEKNLIIAERDKKIVALEEINNKSQNKEQKFLEELENYKKKILELENELDESKSNSVINNNKSVLDVTEIEKTVKDNISKTFLYIMENFEVDSEHSFREIKNIVSKNLKQLNFSILEDIKKCNNVEN